MPPAREEIIPSRVEVRERAFWEEQAGVLWRLQALAAPGYLASKPRYRGLKCAKIIVDMAVPARGLESFRLAGGDFSQETMLTRSA